MVLGNQTSQNHRDTDDEISAGQRRVELLLVLQVVKGCHTRRFYSSGRCLHSTYLRQSAGNEVMRSSKEPRENHKLRKGLKPSNPTPTDPCIYIIL